jgi:hypothetical protein
MLNNNLDCQKEEEEEEEEELKGYIAGCFDL